MSPEQNDGQASGLEPNDDARAPGGTPPSAAPAADGGQPAAALEIDSDDAELAEARAALEAEEAAAKAGQQPEPKPAEQGAQSQGTPASTAGQEDGGKPAPMVPHAVFHKERMGRQALQREADYLRGQIEALQAVHGKGETTTPSAAPPAPSPQPTSAQAEIAAKEAEIFAAAERFDTGEITMAEFKKIEAAAAARIGDLRTSMALAAAMPQAGPSLADTAILTAHINALAEAHPYSQLLTPDQAQWLARREMDEAAAFGRPYGTGPEADMLLQAAVARASDEWGPKFGLSLPPEVAAKRASGGMQSMNTKPGQPPLSPSAQAHLRKMELAAGLPPDTAAMGSGSTGLDLSEAAISAMDEDAIAALPAATRARILNMTG